MGSAPSSHDQWTLPLTVGFVRRPGTGREAHRKRCASARFALDGDRSTVALDDPQTYREPQAGPRHRRFGGEERLEDALDVLGRDARPRVADRDHDLVILAFGPHEN